MLTNFDDLLSTLFLPSDGTFTTYGSCITEYHRSDLIIGLLITAHPEHKANLSKSPQPVVLVALRE
jgi:hypothetical protein